MSVDVQLRLTKIQWYKSINRLGCPKLWGSSCASCHGFTNCVFSQNWCCSAQEEHTSFMLYEWNLRLKRKLSMAWHAKCLTRVWCYSTTLQLLVCTPCSSFQNYSAPQLSYHYLTVDLEWFASIWDRFCSNCRNYANQSSICWGLTYFEPYCTHMYCAAMWGIVYISTFALWLARVLSIEWTCGGMETPCTCQTV